MNEYLYLTDTCDVCGTRTFDGETICLDCAAYLDDPTYQETHA
jgi:hypothetical protein